MPAIKIQIQNDTEWQTKMLRPFIARIACQRGGYTDGHYAWALDLPEPLPTAKPKAPTTDQKRAKALQVAQRAVKRWTSKSKLAATKLKYWQRRVKVLERRLAPVPPVVYISEQEGGPATI